MKFSLKDRKQSYKIKTSSTPKIIEAKIIMKSEIVYLEDPLNSPPKVIPKIVL